MGPSVLATWRWLFVLLGVLLTDALRAQAVEDIFVETYNVQPPADGKGEALTTYRIYVDLAEGCELQMVFASREHPLRILTTTEFFNDTTARVKFADDMSVDRLNKFPATLDSWLTILAASHEHVGVPKHLDPDGSILTCPPYDAPSSAIVSGARKGGSLCASDGLMAASEIKEVVNFRFEPGYFGNIRGNDIYQTDGAWAVLGGVKGVTSENMVLIAQVSTTGSLSFFLNLQVRAADGTMQRYVAAKPTGEEVLFEGLNFPRP